MHPFFFRSPILNWIPTCWWSLFRVFFERNFYFLGPKRVQWNFYWCFRINKHGHISFWIMIAWFLKRLTPATDSSDSKYLIYFFLFFFRPIFCLDCPLRIFNNGPLFLFFLLIFLNALSEKNLKSIAAWKIWLIAPIWCFLLVLVGNKLVTEAKRFLFWVEGSKGVSNTCMPIYYYERNQFSMPSFKIASNIFIIFINKFNDSINMIYCAIFIIFIPRHPSDLEKIL